MEKKDVVGDFQSRLSDLVKEKMDSENKTQYQIAKEIGLQKGQLSKYLNYETEPKITQLQKVANYFNVSADYLLGNIGVKKLEANLQSVHNYTGLSEEAIFNLRCLHNNLSVGDNYNSKDMYSVIVDDREKPVEILSKIIENRNLIAMLYHFLSLDEEDESGIFSNMRANAMMLSIQQILFELREDLKPLFQELHTKENYDAVFVKRKGGETE